jgi:hypothetical protein
MLSKHVNVQAAATLNQNLAEFESVSNKLRPETRGQGSTVNIFINKPSKVVIHSASGIPDDYQEDQEKVVNVVLGSYITYKKLGTVENSNDVLDKEESIIANMRVGLERQLKRQFGFGLLATANTAIAAKGQTWGGQTTSPVAWGDIAQGIELISDSGLADKVSVLVPTGAQSSLLGASATNMWSPSTQEKIFNNKLGEFGGADIIKTNITLRGPAADVLAGLEYEPVAEGDNALTLTAPTAAEIPAGTMFKLAGVYALSIEGEPIYDPYTGERMEASFATPIAVPAGATTLPLGKQIYVDTSPGSATWGNSHYFSDFGASAGGGVQFLSALPDSGENPIAATNVGKNVVLVYGDRSFAVCSNAPVPLGVKEEHTESRFGVSIRTAMQGAVRPNSTEYSMCAIAGFSGCYAPACTAILF